MVNDDLFPYCNVAYNKNFTMFNEFMFKNNTAGSVFFETILYEQRTRRFIYIVFRLVRSVFGQVIKNMVINIVPINIYKHKRDFARLLIEVIYLMYVFYFLNLKFHGIFTIMNNDFERDFMNDP